MADAVELSPLWQATPRAARKVYTIIASEIAASGGAATMTYDALMYDHRCGQPTISLRVLRYLGLIEVTPGKPVVYRLGSGWRGMREAEAQRLVALAREVRPRLRLKLSQTQLDAKLANLPPSSSAWKPVSAPIT
jgi:hypothetical protein